MYVQAMNTVDQDHLAEVIEEMREKGAPTIRVYNDGEQLIALEGSHRLAAAYELGFEPEFVELDEDEEIESDLEGVDGNTALDILEVLGNMSYGPSAERYDIDEFLIENR